MKKGLRVFMTAVFMIMLLSISVFARENTNSFDGTQELKISSTTNLTVETETPSSGKKSGDTVYKVTPTSGQSDIRVLNENVTKPWKNFAGDIDTGYIETEFMLDNDVCELSVYAPVGKNLDGKLGDASTITGLNSGNDYYYFHILKISTTNGVRLMNGSSSEGALFDTTTYGAAGAATKLFDVSKGQWHKIRVTLSRYDGAMVINFDDYQAVRIPYLADSCIAKYGLKLFSFCPRNLSGGSYTNAVYLDNLCFKSTFIGAPLTDTVTTAEQSIEAAAQFKQSLLNEAKTTYTFSFNTTNFTYTVKDESNVCITGFSYNVIPELTDGVLEIPAQIDGIPVTEIGDNAFNKTAEGTDNTNQEATRYAAITELKLPDSIKKINARSFFALCKIGYIKTPSALEEIGDQAFAATRAVSSIELNDGLKTIGAAVFQNCGYDNKATMEELVIPNSVTSIGTNVFRGCKVKRIILSANITTIPWYAFYHCSSLKEVVFKGNITSCGDEAFGGTCADGIQIYSYPSSIEQIKLKGKDGFVYSTVYAEKNYTTEKSGTYTILPFSEACMIQKDSTGFSITPLTGDGQPVTGDFSETKTVYVWEDMQSIKPLTAKIGGNI